MTNEKLLQALEANPKLRARVEALAELSLGTLNECDIVNCNNAEDLIFEQIDGLGRDVLEKWANNRADRVSSQFKNDLNELERKSKKKGIMA